MHDSLTKWVKRINELWEMLKNSNNTKPDLAGLWIVSNLAQHLLLKTQLLVWDEKLLATKCLGNELKSIDVFFNSCCSIIHCNQSLPPSSSMVPPQALCHWPCQLWTWKTWRLININELESDDRKTFNFFQPHIPHNVFNPMKRHDSRPKPTSWQTSQMFKVQSLIQIQSITMSWGACTSMTVCRKPGPEMGNSRSTIFDRTVAN